MYCLLLSALYLSIVFDLCHANDAFRFEISYGRIEGAFHKYKGKTIFKYLGIPYAKPPIGALRFKSPQKPDKWGAIRTDQEKSICVQGTLSYDEFHERLEVIATGNEDCLYLNIFTPKVPTSERYKGPTLPVMVWLHGGEFDSGSANNGRSPDFLVNEDVVVVTVSYRLGVFGFLSLKNSEVPGNMGLKDQVMALKFVQENIHHFGGNNQSVTIFGSDAGAASVQYLMMSNQTKGLFHRAIMQSGSAYNPWASQYNPQWRAQQLAANLQISGALSISSLSTKSSSEIFLAAHYAITADDTTRGFDSIFVPVIESNSSKDPIINQRISDAMNNLTTNDKKFEVMIGFNSGEGINFVAKEKNIQQKVNNLDPVIPREVSNKARAKQLLQNEYIYARSSDTQGDRYAKLRGDAWYGYGIYETAWRLSKISNITTYFYKFNYGAYSFFHARRGITKAYSGLCHGDEIEYFFKHNPNYFGREVYPLPTTGNVINVQNKVLKLWTNFAKTGDPNPQKGVIDVKWEPVTSQNLRYLDIRSTLTMQTFQEESRRKTWNDILKLSTNKNT